VGDMVRMEGFDEARRALKRMEDVDRSREYKAASKEIAELIVREARGNASTRMERRAAQTLQPVALEAGAAVRLGKGFPPALGAEFGADRNQRRLGRPHGTVAPVTGWNQFKPWKGSDTGAGYFMWPAIRANADEIVNRYTALFDELFDEKGRRRSD